MCNDNCGCSNWWWIILLLLFSGNGNGCSFGGNCGGNCGGMDYSKFPGYEDNFGCDCENNKNVDEAAIAEIVKQVIAQMK